MFLAGTTTLHLPIAQTTKLSTSLWLGLGFKVLSGWAVLGRSWCSGELECGATFRVGVLISVTTSRCDERINAQLLRGIYHLFRKRTLYGPRAAVFRFSKLHDSIAV